MINNKLKNKEKAFLLVFAAIMLIMVFTNSYAAGQRIGGFVSHLLQ